MKPGRFPKSILCRWPLPFALAGFAAAQEAKKVTYQDDVLPLLENKCLNCHNPDEAKGGLDLSTFSATMNGGSGGEVAIAEDPLGSRIYTLMAHREEPYMPPQKPQSPDSELKVIADWISGGLLETKNSKGRKSEKPKLDMSVTVTGKPEGPPPMPEHLILQPEVVTERSTTITALAHSPWAPILAVGGQKQVLLYHSADFELLGVLPYPEGFPQALAFSANGSLLICGGGRGGKAGNVVAWDVKTGERVIEVGKEFDIVLGADISPDHKQVVLGGPGRNIKLWDTVKGEQTSMIKKHPDWMLTAAYSPDGVLFATGGRNADLYIWEGGTGYEFYTLKGHTGPVTGLAWRADSNVLASCSEDGQVILWEMTEGKEVKKWNAHPGGAESVDFAPDGRLVTGGRDKTVKIWTADGQQQRAITASDDIVMSVAFSEDNKRVISGDYNGKISVWNVDDGAKLADIDANPPTIDRQLAYSQQRITELTTNLPKLEEGIKVASAKTVETRTALDTAKKNAAESAARKAAMEKLAAELDGKIKALATQQQQAQQALAQKQAIAKQRNDELAKATPVQTTAKTDADKWTAEFKKQEPVVAQLAAAVQSAKTEAEKPLDPATQKALTDATNAQKAAAAAKQQADTQIAPKQKAQSDANTALAAAQKAQTDAQNALAAAQKAQQDAQGKATAADQAAKAAAAKLAEASKNGAQPPAPLVQAKQQADQALQAANQALATATNAAKQADGTLNTRKQAVATAQNTVNGANQALAAAQAAQTEAGKKLAAADAALKPLAEKAKAHTDAQAKAKALLAQKTGEHQKATAALNSAKGQMDAAAKRFADADAKLKAAQTAKTAADGEVQKANTAYADVSKNLNDSRTALAAAQKDSQEAAKQADALAKQSEAQQKALEAVAKAEADAKKAFDVARAELANNQYLTKKWQAATVNLQVHEESTELDDMEVKLDDMEVDLTAKQEDHKKAAESLAQAEKTLATAQKTVADGTKALTEKTTSVLDAVLQLASAKSVANLNEEIVKTTANGEENPAPADDPEKAGTTPDPVELAAADALSSKPREELEKELTALRGRLDQLSGVIQKSYQEADATRKTVMEASKVAAETPAVVAERSKVEDAKEAEARKAAEEKAAYEAAVAAQKKKIEELRQKYLSMAPKREA